MTTSAMPALDGPSVSLNSLKPAVSTKLNFSSNELMASGSAMTAMTEGASMTVLRGGAGYFLPL